MSAESLYHIPDGCICKGDGLFGIPCTAPKHARLKSEIFCLTCEDKGIEYSGVCHCGEEMDRHTYGNSNHGAVEMWRYCEDCDAGPMLKLVDEVYELQSQKEQEWDDKILLGLVNLAMPDLMKEYAEKI
jgi:hypothetical protein